MTDIVSFKFNGKNASIKTICISIFNKTKITVIYGIFVILFVLINYFKIIDRALIY